MPLAGPVASSQGRSKHPSGDRGNGFGAVLVEGLAGLAPILATAAHRRQRAAADVCSAAVLVHRHVADMMRAVLDAQLSAYQSEQPSRRGLHRVEADEDAGGPTAESARLRKLTRMGPTASMGPGRVETSTDEILLESLSIKLQMV